MTKMRTRATRPQRWWSVAASLLLLTASLVSDAAAHSWGPTGDLRGARQLHTASLLSTGDVLVTGGVSNGVTLAAAELYDARTGAWTPTGSLSVARHWHTATVLSSGEALVAGGEDHSPLSETEIYDPTARRWRRASSLRAGRSRHTANLLPSGQVLVAGGYPALASAESYDPDTGRWTLTGSMAVGRAAHTATVLPNGQILVAGGYNAETSQALASAELYDPGSGRWTATGAMSTPRVFHAALLLASGKVLVAGGQDQERAPSQLASAELYDPASGAWTPIGSLNVPRVFFTMTLLPSGQVLVAGDQDLRASAEIYDPTMGRWTLTEAMQGARSGHTATLLPSARVLVAGGYDAGAELSAAELYDPGVGQALAAPLPVPRALHRATLLASGRVLVSGGTPAGTTAHLYDPATNRWSPTGGMPDTRSAHTATLLANGHVLVAGGVGASTGAALYDERANTWMATGRLQAERSLHTATLLPDGRVLVSGGCSGDGFRRSGPPRAPLVCPYVGQGQSTAELYDPSQGTWSPTGAMKVARYGHTATLLPSGKVLVVGGKVLLLGDFEFVAGRSVELYDPGSGTWTTVASLQTGRALHAATLLPSGKVLVVGGVDSAFDALASAELYDPESNTWTSVAGLSSGRVAPLAILLPSGDVLLAGGCSTDPWLTCIGFGNVDRYDPAQHRWIAEPAMATTRIFHSMTLLANGQVLVAGGCPDVGVDQPPCTALSTSELYGPAERFDDAWRPEVDVITPVTVGGAIGVEGTFFTGRGEGSGGNGPQHSATSYPLVQLRRIDNEQTRFVPVDPVAGWSDGTFTSLPLADFLPGPAMVTVSANAVPSIAEIVMVGRPGLGDPPGQIHVDRPRVSSLHVSHGEAVDVTTTVRAGKAAVAHLVVRLYEGAREVAAAHVFHLHPRERDTVHQTFTAQTCGVRPLSVVVEAGSTEYRRDGPTLRVDCHTNSRSGSTQNRRSPVTMVPVRGPGPAARAGGEAPGAHARFPGGDHRHPAVELVPEGLAPAEGSHARAPIPPPVGPGRFSRRNPRSCSVA